MKNKNKFLYIVLIIFIFLNLSAFNFNDIVQDIGSKINNFLNIDKETSNNEVDLNKEYVDIFDNLFNSIKTCLENAEIDLAQNYIAKDIKYKSSINFVVNKYKNIKNVSKVYFDKIDYSIKDIKLNNDESISVNVDIKIPNTTKLIISNIPSFISKNIISKFDLNNPSVEVVDDLISIISSSLDDDNVSLQSYNFDFKIIKYNNEYKIESINNIIQTIEDNISSLLNTFNFK